LEAVQNIEGGMSHPGEGTGMFVVGAGGRDCDFGRESPRKTTIIMIRILKRVQNIECLSNVISFITWAELVVFTAGVGDSRSWMEGLRELSVLYGGMFDFIAHVRLLSVVRSAIVNLRRQSANVEIQ
jgi:hypothetical protein